MAANGCHPMANSTANAMLGPRFTPMWQWIMATAVGSAMQSKAASTPASNQASGWPYPSSSVPSQW